MKRHNMTIKYIYVYVYIYIFFYNQYDHQSGYATVRILSMEGSNSKPGLQPD